MAGAVGRSVTTRAGMPFETEVMRKLKRRTALVRGYEPKCFRLFSKHTLPSDTIEKAEGTPAWHLLTAEGLYRLGSFAQMGASS